MAMLAAWLFNIMLICEIDWEYVGLYSALIARGGGPGSLRLSVLVARGHNLKDRVLHTCFVKKKVEAWPSD